MYLFLTENKLHLFINREEIKNLNFISISLWTGKKSGILSFSTTFES